MLEKREQGMSTFPKPRIMSESRWWNDLVHFYDLFISCVELSSMINIPNGI